MKEKSNTWSPELLGTASLIGGALMLIIAYKRSISMKKNSENDPIAKSGIIKGYIGGVLGVIIGLILLFTAGK